MDILGIGFPELLFIFFIALMVFGPRRLPEIAGKAGKIVRDLRNMSQGFLTEWQREITVATRLEELEEVRKELEETKKSLRQTQADIATGTAQVGQSINSIAPPKSTKPSPSPAKSAQTVPRTPETTPDSNKSSPSSEEAISGATQPTEMDERAVETPLPKEADLDSIDTSSAHLSLDTGQNASDAPDTEKNGNSNLAVPKSAPSTISSSGVAE